MDVYIDHLTLSFNFENKGSACDFLIILIALFCGIFILFNELCMYLTTTGHNTADEIILLLFQHCLYYNFSLLV